MRKLLIVSMVASMFTESFLRVSIIGLSAIKVKPKENKRVTKKKEWKQNLRSTNQRQKGLRSPIGRGK